MFPSSFQSFLYFFSVSFLFFYKKASFLFFQYFFPRFLRVSFLFLTRKFPSYFFFCVSFLIFESFLPIFLLEVFLPIFSVFPSSFFESFLPIFYKKFPSYFRIFRDVSEIAPCLNANYTCLNRPLGNYFSCRFAYREIIEFLKVYHNKNISLPTVKKKF